MLPSFRVSQVSLLFIKVSLQSQTETEFIRFEELRVPQVLSIPEEQAIEW